jgi:hypothetical protein
MKNIKIWIKENREMIDTTIKAKGLRPKKITDAVRYEAVMYIWELYKKAGERI